MVIDYRTLNGITIQDRYPIPEINEVLSILGENKLFTVIDLKSGFHQIPLRESDVERPHFPLTTENFNFYACPLVSRMHPQCSKKR